jgi:hypothetical protein
MPPHTRHPKEMVMNTVRGTGNDTSSRTAISTGAVISADGTTIGYLRVGHGPAVVLLHGSNESARSHIQLALALASSFTVTRRTAVAAACPARTARATACAPR